MSNDLDDIESFWDGLRPKREIEPEPEPKPQLPSYLQTPDRSNWDVPDLVGLTMSSVTGEVGGGLSDVHHHGRHQV